MHGTIVGLLSLPIIGKIAEALDLVRRHEAPPPIRFAADERPPSGRAVVNVERVARLHAQHRVCAVGVEGVRGGALEHCAEAVAWVAELLPALERQVRHASI
eukprot:5122941-Prymnesium_polylepis.4